MWTYFGLGEGFVDKLSAELGKQQISPEELNGPKELSEEAIQQYLSLKKFADNVSGTIDYGALIAYHP